MIEQADREWDPERPSESLSSLLATPLPVSGRARAMEQLLDEVAKRAAELGRLQARRRQKAKELRLIDERIRRSKKLLRDLRRGVS